MRLTVFLLLAATLLITIAALRPPEYDEAYSIFLTAGDPRPAWLTVPFHPSEVRSFYNGHASLSQIAFFLRATDVHPPLYFWSLEAWRHIFGPAWLTSRLLSVLFSVATLATLAHLARQTKTPVIPTLLITLLAYGYAYTSTITRNFALAQLLTTAALSLTVRSLGWAEPPRKRGEAHCHPNNLHLAAAGALFSLATFTNYLSVFTPAATLVWLTTLHPSKIPSCRRKLASTASFLAGLSLFLPLDFYFFTAQHASRATQFPPFHPIQAALLIAKDSGAAIFGGLPLYAGAFGPIIAAALLIFFLICLAKAAKPSLFTLTALATPIGLFFLGLAFHNTPIEIRYLAFGIPSLALILATLPKPLLTTLIALESLGTIGLALAPSTMQPQALAARQAAALATPGALVLVPYGNDGVGIPGPFIEAAPSTLNILLIRPGEAPDIQAPRIILARLRADDSSREAVEKTLNYLENNPCWTPGPSTALTSIFENRCPHQQN
jgi:hypothetical protein